MKVPYFDFKLAPSDLKKKWETALLESLNTYEFVLGASVSKFESEWANFIGTKYSVGVGNGFDGLVLALKALNLMKGFRVAVPAHTFIASWNAVHYAGGIPVGVDVTEDGLIDIEKLMLLNPLPDVVMPVHMHGRMVDMPKLVEWARIKQIRIVEDASQAHGAIQNGLKAGAWGDISVFSLYPSKNLGAFGDAGVVCTNSEKFRKQMKSLRNYGASERDKYQHTQLGVNSRLDALQSQVLLVNLEYLPIWNERRREIANQYLTKLLPNVQMTLPRSGGNEMVWHHFAIKHEQRDSLQQYLKELQIQTQIHYPFPAGIEFGKFDHTEHSYVVSEGIASKTLSLPMSPWHKDSQIQFVIESINQFHENKLKYANN